MLSRWFFRGVFRRNRLRSSGCRGAARFRPSVETLEERCLLNQAPIAQINGPYTVPQQGSVALSAAGSSDPEGSPLIYQWDFNYTGGPFEVDATGPSPNFSASGLPAGTVRTITLRVIDNGVLYGATVAGQYFSINIMTGAGTSVGTFTAPGSANKLTEIVYNNSSNQAFAQFLDSGFTTFRIEPFNINTAAATGSAVADTGSFTGLAYVGSQLYGTMITSSSSDSQFGTLDPTTGIFSVINADTHRKAISGLAYDPNSGTLYGVDGGSGPADLLTIDLPTGAVTAVGQIESGSFTSNQFGSLQFGPDGKLYAGANDSFLWRINISDPTQSTRIGYTGFGGGSGNALSGLAYVTAPATSTIVTTTVTVQDVPPTLSNVNITPTITEPGTATLTGTINDNVTVNPFTMVVNWGDGTVPQTFHFPAGTTSFNQTHSYQISGTFNVTLTLGDDTHVGALFYGSDDSGKPYTINLTTGAFTSVGNLPNTPGLSATEIEHDNFDPNPNRAWLQYGGTAATGQAFNLTNAAGLGTTVVNAAGEIYNGLAFNGSTLYAAGRTGTGSTAPTDLFILNPFTGAGTFVAHVTGVNGIPGGPIAGLAFDPQDRVLYGIRGGNSTTANLFQIDPMTGAVTNIVSTGFAAGSLRFGPDGQLYAGSNTGQLYQVNPTTGATVLVGATGSSAALSGLALVDTAAKATSTVTVNVEHEPPVLKNVGITSPISENGTATLSGTIVDSGPTETYTLLVDWGDGTTPQTFNYAAGTTSFSVMHQYLKNGTLPVQLTLTDSLAAQAMTSVNVTINNTAPTLSGVSIDSSIKQGDLATLTGTINDPGTQDTFSLAVDWGDGSTPQTFNFSAGGATSTPFSETHVYTKAGNLTASATVTDADNASSSPVNLGVMVQNVPPTLSNVSITGPTNEGGVATLTGNISDPGIQDTFTLVVNWGDGSTPQTFHYAAGTTAFSETHRFLQMGNFPVGLSLTDSPGGLTTAGTTAKVVLAAYYAVGPESGSAEVKLLDARSQVPKLDFYAYDGSVTGGVRVALADVTGDGMPDIITVPGPGAPAEVKVFDGVSGALIRHFYAFPGTLTTGFFVAAGDLTGHGLADIVVSLDAGPASEVRAFDGTTTATLYDFFPYGGFSGGVQVAVGNVNGDGFGDIVTGTGPGTTARVRAFSGTTGAMLLDFYAYGPSDSSGLSIAVGDVNGDGRAVIVTGNGAGEVRAFSGATGTMLLDFYAYGPSLTGGISLAVGDLNGDGRADITAGLRNGSAPQLRAFDAVTSAMLDNFYAYDPLAIAGLFVADGHMA
jgi:hypothetical protein